MSSLQAAQQVFGALRKAELVGGGHVHPLLVLERDYVDYDDNAGERRQQYQCVDAIPSGAAQKRGDYRADEHCPHQRDEGGSDGDVDVAVQPHRAYEGDYDDAGYQSDDAGNQKRRAENAHGVQDGVKEADQGAGSPFLRFPAGDCR